MRFDTLQLVLVIHLSKSLAWFAGLAAVCLVPLPGATAGADLPPGTLLPGPSMSVARSHHTAAFTADGRILIAGGVGPGGIILATTEICDPNKEKVIPAARMLFPRADHISVKLGDTKILMAGGRTRGGAALASSEDYDSEENHFTRQGDMHARRIAPTATMLRDGRVLVTGGEDGTQPLASAETYDLLNGHWTLVGNMTTPRAHHTATLMLDGRVLIAGGTGLHHAVLASAEIFDPRTNRFTPAANLRESRFAHTAGLLSTGKVLIAGGMRGPAAGDALQSAEIYWPKPGQPAGGDFVPTGSLLEPHVRLSNSYTLLDGRVVIVGGAASAEIFDPRTNSFRTVTGGFDTARYHAATIQLIDGTLRIFGGADAKGASTAKSWIYRP